MRLKMIPNSGMIGKEERGSDGSRSLSSSSSPPVEGPESLQGQGFEPSSPTPGLYLCLDWLVFFMFHESYDPAYECDWARWPTAHMVDVRSRVWVSQGPWMHAFLLSPPYPPLPRAFFFCFHFSGWPFNVSSLWFQLFVIVVWNFELYMIPLALLLPLVWNYILLVSGKDTRQDVVSNLIASLVSPQRRIKPMT